MKKLACLSLFISLGISIAFAMPATQASKATPQKPSDSSTAKSSPSSDDGERAFKANCSRCHYAPDTLNPRMTGTVIRHMRVRANLSAADERAILHYLNP